MAKLIDLIVSGKTSFANDINAKTIYSTRLYMSGAISTCNAAGSWVSGMTNAAIMYNNNTAISASSYYHPFLSMKAAGGHVVNFGGLNNNIGFYGFYNGRTANDYDWRFTVNSATGQWSMSESITSSAFITSGGANTQIVRGDGTLQTISSLSVNYANSAGSATYASSAGDADKLDGEHGTRYTRALGSPNYITINVGGNADTYYPVVISNVSDCYPMQLVNISRAYYETAPDTWNTSTHRGGLTLTLLWNGSRYWDGNSSGDACYCVYKNQTYSTMVGGLENATGGKVVWLRGGGAVYHIHSMNGTSTTATVYTSTYTDSASRSFAPKTYPDGVSVRWPGYAEGADYAASAGNADTVDSQHFSYSNDSNSPTYLWATNSNGSSFLAARGSLSVNYANSAGSVAWGNISSKPDTATRWPTWSEVTNKPINFKAYSGSLATGGWKTLQGKDSSPSIAISYNTAAASWNSGTYSSSLVYGSGDTRGLLDCAYNTPLVTFGGCAYGASDDNNPTWYIKLSGTNGTTYNLNSMPYAVSAGYTKFLETFIQGSTTNTYGSQYPIWAQWSDTSNVRLKCTNYTVWTDKANYAINTDKLDNYHESDFFRYRGDLYQKHDYDANTLGIGEYVFRSAIYGNVGTGANHANALNENSTIQVFKWLQMSAAAWSDSMSYRLNWSNETNTQRPNGWSPWITFVSSTNYTDYVNTTNFPGLNKTGTVTSVTVTGANGLSGSGTVTSSGTITLSNAGVRSTTINGNYLRVNTNGTNADLTIPYATYASSSPAAANYGGTGNTTKIKIKINSTTEWMLSFVVTIYQGYKSSKIMVSGYNYSTNYWYNPEAVLLGDSNGATSIPVYFGYDSASNLWVGFDGGSYTGVSISDVTNGYRQISSYKDLFTISNVSSLSTLQTTITATNSVNYAAYAASAGNADKVDGQHFAYSNDSNSPTYLWATNSNGSSFLAARAKISVNYANSAGSVAWNNVSSKPDTATRWPAWSEITNKPSSFTPSSHTHSYLPLSGGTMTGTIKYGEATYEIIRTGGDNNTWRGGLKYSWSSNTTIALWGKNANSQFVWHAGTDFSSNDVNGTSNRSYDFQVGRVNGTLEALIGGNKIWHAGNDGSGSGLDADTVDGQHFSYSNTSNSPTYLWATNSSGTSFLAARTSLSVNYANSAGSVAWANITGKPSSFTPASHNHDTVYVKKAGDTMTGLLTTTSGSHHNGIKVGDTYINAISGDLIFQNKSSIRFGGDSWDYNSWAGLKYVHSSKIIYLGLADGTAFIANSAQSGGKLYLPGIDNVYTGNGTNLVWHAGNDGSGSGLDADKTDGLHVHSGRNSEANKIVRTDGNGYLQTGYINTNVSTENNRSCSRLFFESNDDGYIRKLTPARFRELITDPVYLPRLRMRNPSNGTSSQGAIPFPISLKGAGYPVYTDPEFASGKNNIFSYKTSGDGTVTITRIADNQGASNSSGKILQISSAGTIGPGRGGFYQEIKSRANAVFAQIFRAKIPTGFSVVNAENSMGTRYSTHWLTDTAGTGKWEWYIRVTICGASGTFSSGGHVYLSGSGAVTWYLSYCNVIDLTKGKYDGLRTRYSDSADYAYGADEADHANYADYADYADYLSTSAGSTTKPIYFNGGKPAVCTHNLNATVNSGTAGNLAYYAGANAISSYTTSLGGDGRPVYLSEGKLKVSSVGIIWCGDVHRTKYTETSWYASSSFSSGMTTSSGEFTSISASVSVNATTGLMTITLSAPKMAVSAYAAFASTKSIYNGSTYYPNTGQVSGRSGGLGDYWTDCDRSKVYIKKFKQQNGSNDSWADSDLITTTTDNGNKPILSFNLLIIGDIIKL